MAYDYQKAKSAYEQLSKDEQQQFIDRNKDNANVQQFARDYAAEMNWNKNQTSNQTATTPTKTNTTTAVPEYQWQWTNKSNSYVNKWEWTYTYSPETKYYEKNQNQTSGSISDSTPTSDMSSTKSNWDNMSYADQQKKLNEIPWLKEALTKKGWKFKTEDWTPTQTETTTETPKTDKWDYSDNSPERMKQMADNVNWFYQTDPWIFNSEDSYRKFFIDWKGRTPEQEAFLMDLYKNRKIYNDLDNYTADEIWAMDVHWQVPESYLNYLKNSDPERYAAVMDAKAKEQDKIKDKTSLETTNVMTWEDDENTITSKAIEWLKAQWLFIDKDWNFIDDRTENYATEEEKGYAKSAADIIARNLDIDNTVKHTYDDLVEKYWWTASKATLMAMAQDINSDLLREKENNNVELTRLQWYMNYMQQEREDRTAIWQKAIEQLQKQYGMYYTYSPEWMSELAQAQYAATNVTLDQADNWTDTQKQMALDGVLTPIYEQYWDIIERPKAQVINDVIAYANKKWISLSQALKENFTDYLKQKPAYSSIQNALSEPNLQIIWYNSDWKAVYGYWDGVTKTFKQVSVSWWTVSTAWWWIWSTVTAWNWKSYTVVSESDLADWINNFLDKYQDKDYWDWCWAFVNKWLKEAWVTDWNMYWDSLQSKLDTKNEENTADAQAGWVAIRNPDNLKTEDWKKYWHVWFVVKDNWNWTVVIRDSNWTPDKNWNYNKTVWTHTVRKSQLYWFFNPSKWAWATAWTTTVWWDTTTYNKAFIDAANVIKQQIDWLQNKKDFMDDIENYLENWDYATAFSMITWAWRANADSATKEKINAAETAIVDLISIKDAIEAYYIAWWDTWILQWTLEDVENALWMTSDPKLVWLSTKISEAIQAYRKNISWTAFSEKEAKDYEKLFPSIKAWQKYNTAKIQEVLDSMIIRANWQYSNLIWPWIYKNLLDAHEQATWRKYSIYEEQSDLYRYLMDNWYLTPSWTVKTANDFASWYQAQQYKNKWKRF